MGTAATSRTRPTRATAMDAMDAVEIKVTIRPDQELRAERALEVNEDTADVRLIYFYDTPRLDLFDAGVCLRARLVKGDDDDSTVKFRPPKGTKARIDVAEVSQAWKRVKGFKLEADCVGDKVVHSASLTVRQRRDEIDQVAKGKRTIAKLFSKEQERFLREFAPRPVDAAALCVLGPIRVLRWKLKHKRFPYELTMEEWRLPDGQDLVEVSIKTAPEHAREARKAFEAHLRELGLDPEGAQETKTRTALKYFAKHCAKPER